MVHISHACLTEKQTPHNFWYYSIPHTAEMINMITGKLKGQIAYPFMPVCYTQADSRMWFPLSPVCYFLHENNGNVSRSRNQIRTMDVITAGRSHTLLVYNPHNRNIYHPDTYKFDPTHISGAIYPSIDGRIDSLTAMLLVLPMTEETSSR